MSFCFTNNPFLSDLISPGFELGFDQSNDVRIILNECFDDGEDQSKGDKRNIRHNKVWLPVLEVLRCDIAKVRSFHHMDTWIASEFPIKLVVTDINRIHFFG